MPAGVHKEKRVTKETQKQQEKKKKAAVLQEEALVWKRWERDVRRVYEAYWLIRARGVIAAARLLSIHFSSFFFLFMIRLVFFFTNDDECMCWRVWACSFV